MLPRAASGVRKFKFSRYSCSSHHVAYPRGLTLYKSVHVKSIHDASDFHKEPKAYLNETRAESNEMRETLRQDGYDPVEENETRIEFPNRRYYVRSRDLNEIRKDSRQDGNNRLEKSEVMERFPNRQFTIRARDPSITTKRSIISAVSRIQNHLVYRNGNTRQSLVIIATPAFAKWLEDDVEFMPSLIKRTLQVKEDGPPFLVDVLAAVVDGLSPTAKYMTSENTRPPAEGFSVLQGLSSTMLPNMLDLESSTNERSSFKQSSLTFLSKAGASPDGPNDLKVTLPLANTLFTNGKHSTLLLSKWGFEGKTLTKLTSAEKHSQDVRIMMPFPSSPILITESQRAIPLTIPRRIVSGLGNIVRQIDFGFEGPGPASRELEENVPAYLAVAQQALSKYISSPTKGSLLVWALVVPDHLAEEFISSSPSDLVFNSSFVRKTSHYRRHVKDLTLVAGEPLTYWIGRGATLCRVLSGGGGWGAKQGLLSLDPQTTYSDIAEGSFDPFSGSLEEQQISALGNIAKPGSYIQFFTCNPKRPMHKETVLFELEARNAEPPHESESHKAKSLPQPLSWSWSSLFGTVPSTIDSLPTQKVPDSDQDEGELTAKPGKKNLKSLRGHFGAVSESGLFLNFKAPGLTNSTDLSNDAETPTISTKVDLPYTFVCQEWKYSRLASSTEDDSSLPATDLKITKFVFPPKRYRPRKLEPTDLPKVRRISAKGKPLSQGIKSKEDVGQV